MTDLILPVKRLYFEQIREGKKTQEYRLLTHYWRKRLEGRTYNRVIITLGYPKADDDSCRLVFPWKGYTIKTITHPHFGEQPVEVYAIEVDMRNEKREEAPFRCKYCGQPSWFEPSEQEPPADYCHESDHGEPDIEES